MLCITCYGFVAEPSVPDSGVQNLGVELAGGVLSRPVSPKLAHEAVLAKPPYFETPPIRAVSRECGKSEGCPKCKERDW